MTARVHKNLPIRGTIYPDADAAAEALGVTAMTVREHARNGTLDRCGAGLSGPPPCPVRVRGHDFVSPEHAAAHFDVSLNHVYRRLSEGRPNDIGLPDQRGQHLAKPVEIGPVRFRSRAEASRKLGFCPDYVSRAYTRNSARMKERILAAAMVYAANRATSAEWEGLAP